MDIIKVMQKRYSTKAFDSTKQIPEELLKKVESLLRLSASSLNLQPWFFTIATTKKAKEKIAKAANGNFILNKAQILDASAVVVFSARRDIDQKYLSHLLKKEKDDGRFQLINVSTNKSRGFEDSNDAKKELRDELHNIRMAVINNLEKEKLQNWIDKQSYLNAGTFLLGVAALGLDSLAIEGFDSSVVDKELNLSEKGLASLLLVPIGYHTDEDFNIRLPKSRLLKEDIIKRI